MRECWWSHIYVADIYEWVKFDADPSRNLEPADPNILFDSVWFTWAGHPGVFRVAKVYIHFHFYVFIHPKKWGHPRSINWVTVCLLPITHAAQRRSFSWNTLILKWPLLSNIQVVPFSIFPSAWGWGDNDQIFISALTVSLNVWQPHINPQSPYRLSVSVETDTQLVWLTHDEGRGRRWGAKKKTWRLKTH